MWERGRGEGTVVPMAPSEAYFHLTSQPASTVSYLLKIPLTSNSSTGRLLIHSYMCPWETLKLKP